MAAGNNEADFTRLKYLCPVTEKDPLPETPPFLRVTANTPLYQKVQKILTKSEELDFVTPSTKVPHEGSSCKDQKRERPEGRLCKSERLDKKKGKLNKKCAGKSRLDFSAPSQPSNRHKDASGSPHTSPSSSKENSPNEKIKSQNDQEMESPHQKFFTPKAHTGDTNHTEERKDHPLLILDGDAATGTETEKKSGQKSPDAQFSISCSKPLEFCEDELGTADEPASIISEKTEPNSFVVDNSLSCQNESRSQSTSNNIDNPERCNSNSKNAPPVTSSSKGVMPMSGHTDTIASSGSVTDLLSASPDQFYTPVCKTPVNTIENWAGSTPVSAETGKEFSSKLKEIRKSKKRKRMSGLVQPLCPEGNSSGPCINLQSEDLNTKKHDNAVSSAVNVKSCTATDVVCHASSNLPSDVRDISPAETGCMEISQSTTCSPDLRAHSTLITVESDFASVQPEGITCPSEPDLSCLMEASTGQGQAITVTDRLKHSNAQTAGDKTTQAASTVSECSSKDSVTIDTQQHCEKTPCTEETVTESIQLDDVFLDDLPMPDQQPKKRSRKRRKSADFDIINSSVIESPVLGEDVSDLPQVSGCRRSRRLRRKSLEIYRNQRSHSQETAEPERTELPEHAEETSGNKHESQLYENVSDETSVSDSQAGLTLNSSESFCNVKETEYCTTETCFMDESTKQSSVILSDQTVEEPCTSFSADDGKSEDAGETCLSTTNSVPNLLCTETDICFDESTSYLDDSGSESLTPGKSKKKGRKKTLGPSLEEIYTNKLWRTQMPKEKKWETIYEHPQLKGKSEVLMGRNKFKRALSEQEFYTQAKLKKRRQKALKMGWKPVTKNRQKVLEKLVCERINSM